MKPLTTIITPTYNKPAFFREAAQSILNQTIPDWRWWVILDGADDETTAIAQELADRDARIVLFTERVEDRHAEYRPAMLANKYFPLVSTKYLCWHSDDDLKEPCFLEALVGELERNPGSHVAYGKCRGFVQNGEEWIALESLPEDPTWRFGPDSDLTPDCRLDSGQVLWTRASWDLLSWQFPSADSAANHVDGMYLEKLARQFEFRFVDRKVQTIRHSHLSENLRGSPVKKPVTRTKGTNEEAAVQLWPILHWPSKLENIGYFQVHFAGGDAALTAAGRLMAIHPFIKRVSLARTGEVRKAPFVLRVEREEIQAGKGELSRDWTCLGFGVLVEPSGVAYPVTLLIQPDPAAGEPLRAAGPISLAQLREQSGRS